MTVATATPDPEPDPRSNRLTPPSVGESPDFVATVHRDGYMLFAVMNHYAETWARKHLSDDDEKNWLGRSVLVHPKIGNKVVKLAREDGFKVLVKR